MPHNKESAYLVLDSGVGSATWLLEAAKQLSASTILHGVDIERKMLPSDRPINVSFSLNTVTNLPAEWTERFDFVHQRLLLTALRRDEWVTAISNMHRVLRPRGWIQLGEVGDWHAGPVTAHHLKLVQAIFAFRQLVLDVSKDLPKLVEEGGFSNISVETRKLPVSGLKGRGARENWIQGFRGLKTPVLGAGGLGFVNSEAEFDALIDGVEKEWEATEGAEINFHIICAQK